MERARIIEMMDSGRIPDGADMEGLRRLSAKYPYCSTFRVLLAMGAKEKDDLELKDYINTASVFVQDRSKLYDYVVRDGLLRKIEEGQQTETADLDGESQPKTIHMSTSDSDEVETAGTEVIDQDPLEEQIMAAAVMQLGELEMDSGLSASERGDDTEDAQSENEIKLSPFSRFLTKLNGDEAAKPEREIIEKFISEDRKITPAKQAFFSPSQMGKMSLMEDESFVTETLAKIYERQGDYKKAARAYKNLGLKYPEKRRYFAALQKEAEEKI